MPKGKPKKGNPDLYQGSPTSAGPSMAPQAVAHRRGGTHKVRDEDRTDSIYDTYNYKELLDTAKERGIYRKDMKKGEMAWALKRNDEEKRKEQHQAKIEYQRKQQQARKEQEKKDAQLQALIVAKQKRRLERMQKRDRDESVSDDTPSEDENDGEANEAATDLVGQALSDDSWDSTSTESSVYSTSDIPAHDCKLRLFEWPYDYMPRPDPIAKTIADLARLPDPPPRPAPYAPLKLTTTQTRQKLILPGSKYPASVAPNYVPILPPETRVSAHSHQQQPRLTGLLRNAVVETGAFWAEKTVVQGSTGRMYFHLGSRNESKSLADTYQKWYMEDRRLLRVGAGAGRAGGLGKDERTWRHEERRRNKGRRVAELYESSRWRPVAMGFLPAYLDFGRSKGQGVWVRDRWKNLANLRYVRFKGCDVPHYYFWVKEGDEGFVRDRGIFEFVRVREDVESEEEEEEEEESVYEELGAHNSKEKDFIHKTPGSHIKIDFSNNSLTNTGALYRRADTFRTHARNDKHAVVEKWLDGSSLSSTPSSQASNIPSTPTLSFLDAYSTTAEIPEAVYEDLGCYNEDDSGSSSTTAKALYRRPSTDFMHPKDSKDTAVEKWLDGSSSSPFLSRVPDLPSASALGFLDAYSDTEEEEMERSTRPTCPFCNLHWDGMAAENQGAHMLSHNASSLPPNYHSFYIPRINTTLGSSEDDDVGTQADVDTPIKPRHQRKKKAVSTRREQRKEMERRVVGFEGSRGYDMSPPSSPPPTSSRIPARIFPPRNDNVSPILSDSTLVPLPSLKRGKRKRKEPHDTSVSARERCAYKRQKGSGGVAKVPWGYEDGDSWVARVHGRHGNEEHMSARVLGKDKDEAGAEDSGEGNVWSRCVVF